MFPDNFVKVLPGSSSSTNLHQTVDGDVVQLRNKKRCKVLFSYQPVSEDERNSKNIIQSAKINNESDKTSTKAPQPEESITITKQSPQSQKSEDSRKSSLSTSQRSQIGPDSPAPDTAPRLPPKPGKNM